MNVGYWVYCCSPLDFYDLYLPTVSAMLEKFKKVGDAYFDQGRLLRDFKESYKQAQIAVACHNYWEEERRYEDYVGFAPENESPFFIFKLHNNGTTFIVSEIPCMSDTIRTTYLDTGLEQDNPMFVPITITGGSDDG